MYRRVLLILASLLSIALAEEDILKRIDHPSFSGFYTVPDVMIEPRSNGSKVSSEQLLEELTKFQTVAVNLRKSYFSTIREMASWVSEWYLHHIPEFYSCVARVYFYMISREIRLYPKAIINTIKGMKELILSIKYEKSYWKTDTSKIIDTVNEAMVGFSTVMKNHGNELKTLAVRNVVGQLVWVTKMCKLPLSERHSGDDEVLKDRYYVFEEDYDPEDYMVM